MQNMDHVTCMVLLSNDIQHTVERGAWNPVSFPEVEILRHMHGETAVREIQYLETVKTTTAEEKRRLEGIYGPDIAELVYPGRVPHMEMTVGADAPKPVAKPKKRTRKPKAAAAVEPVADDPDPEIKDAPPEWAENAGA